MSKYLNFFIITFLFFGGCIENHYQNKVPKKVNFNNVDGTSKEFFTNNKQTIYVAVSAMLSPKETLTQYKELFSYLSKKLNRPIKLKQRKTYGEVNELLKSGGLDFALVCSGAYVVAKREFPIYILAVPVVRGEHKYQAYIIVNKKSKIYSFKQLKGKSFAYTDLLSNTGYKYALKLLRENHFDPKTFFSNTIFTHGHDYSIQAVQRGIVDGATVESLIFNYLKIKDSSKVKNIRIIKKSEKFGIPPLVYTDKSNKKLVKKIREVLFKMHKTPMGKKILKELLIDKFIQGKEELYNSVKEFN